MGSKYVKWDITSKCNLRCAHCSVGKTYFAGKTDELSIEEKLAITEKLADAGVEGLSLLGGEPLTMGQEMISLVKHAVSGGLKISLVTNGLLLTGRIMEELTDVGLDRVVVSIEGASAQSHEAVRGKNTYERVIHNVKNFTTSLRRRNLSTKVNINTVLNRLNLGEINEFIDLCLWMEVDEWTALSLIGSGFAQDHLEALMLTPKQEIEAARTIAERCSSSPGADGLKISPQIYPLVWDYVEQTYGFQMPKSRICCNASISLGFIAPDGNMYPCDRVATELYRGQKIGASRIRPMSLAKHGFYEIWNSDYYVDMFQLIVKDETYADYAPCNHCHYFTTRHCNPCPLYSLDAKVRIESCLIAEQALGDIAAPRSQGTFLDSLSISTSLPETTQLPDDMELNEKALGKVPIKRAGVRSIERGDGLLLMNPYRVEFVGLDEIGKLVWRSLDAKQTIDEMATELHEVAVQVLGSVSDSTCQDVLGVRIRAGLLHFFQTLEVMDLIAAIEE